MVKNMVIQVLFIHLVESLMVKLHALVIITSITKVMTMLILEIANTNMKKRKKAVMERKMKKMKVVITIIPVES